ncbi:adhesion G-protein coupled receptor D1-like [Gigantopelta aegis]|uniref:adhesion G-protein coupled receptor D1-like n=1 Tax=Gigantopelta aegis TaxID=1735272 RepID=UPI001B88D4CA|nr:adhesion G-protein coupled receptor D1-like [Gigantopelta aegis]
MDCWVWSSLGCSVTSHDDQTVHCQCNHTTNFAILMQVRHIKIAAVHVIALSSITYIGCSITLLTQFMAVTVFTFVGSLNCERVFIHRNLCIAIGAAQITFLAGIKAVSQSMVCAVVALVLHYFYTAMFIWMLVEGLHLYSKVVQVFGTEKSRIIYYTIFGWGVPLVLVVISAGADWEGYGTSYSCWLSTRRNTIWAFVGPALAIMFVNIVILAAVVRIIMASAKLNRLGEYDHIRSGIKGTLFLLPLLGLTWIFGLVAVNEELVVFQYLFAIVNSLQGFFIFLFHCVLNTEVRQALKRLKQRRSLQRGDNVSSGSNSQSILSTAWLPTKPSKQLQHKGNQVTPQREKRATTVVAAWTGHNQSKETDDSEITRSSRSSPDADEMTLFI